MMPQDEAFHDYLEVQRFVSLGQPWPHESMVHLRARAASGKPIGIICRAEDEAEARANLIAAIPHN